MKKILAIYLALVFVLMCFSFAGCGNMSMGPGAFTFEHVHFSDGIMSHCGTVEKWYDNEMGIEVKTTEFGPLYLAEGSYILVGNVDNCPYCN